MNTLESVLRMLDDVLTGVTKHVHRLVKDDDAATAFATKYVDYLNQSARYRFVEIHDTRALSEETVNPNPHVDGAGSGIVQFNITLEGTREVHILNGDGAILRTATLKRGSMWCGNPSFWYHKATLPDGGNTFKGALSINIRVGYAGSEDAVASFQKMKYFVDPDFKAATVMWREALKNRAKCSFYVAHALQEAQRKGLEADLRAKMENLEKESTTPSSKPDTTQYVQI